MPNPRNGRGTPSTGKPGLVHRSSRRSGSAREQNGIGFAVCESARRILAIRVSARVVSDSDRALAKPLRPAWVPCDPPMADALQRPGPSGIVRLPSRRGGSSQGGVKVPTGGKRPTFPKRYTCLKPASAFFASVRKGQQIRCDSEADGHSPDERERVPEGRVCAWPAVRMP